MPGGHQAQLEWESRVGRLAGAAAIGSAVLTIVSVAVQIGAYQDVEDTDRARLIAIDDNAGQIWAAIGIRDVGIVLLAFVLWFLYRATRYRTPLPGILLPLIPLAPVLLIAASIINQSDIVSIASEFVDEGQQTETRAENLADDLAPVGSALGVGGTLALALALLLISLNAMRAGLLSRFMGIIGIITGALLVLPLAPIPVVQVFWLGALGALFLDRWPGGRGPAWETGEAEPWPSAAQLRAEAVGDQLRDRPDPDPGPAPEPGPEPQGPEHPTSKKRKRKRRR